MEQKTRILAEVQAHDASSCKFSLEIPLFNGFARFPNRESAVGSPLALRLFAIEGITSVQITDKHVYVSKQGAEGWRALGPAIGTAIREFLATGEPAVSAETAKNLPKEDLLRAQVQRILDEQVNPAVASHGGSISLLDVRGNDVFIKMGGGCQGCGQAAVTLRSGVEQALRTAIPDLGEIYDSSDHAAGKNPYYAAH